MKKLLFSLAAVMLMTACGNKEKQLQERAAELCKYIPDHELLQQSKNYMTEDFYNVLDTMFNHLPQHEAMDQVSACRQSFLHRRTHHHNY